MQRVIVSLLFVASLHGQEQVTFSSSAPPAPSSVGASAFGARGGATLYYWVVARYPGGASSASMAVAFSTVGAGNLTGSNYVRVSWAPSAGATGYDVLRSETPMFPGPTCAACAVVLNTASTSVDDNGGAMSAYPPGGLQTAVPVTASLTINNRDGALPYVNVQLLSIRLNEVLRLGMISGTPADDDCIKYTGGRLASAGAPCGSGGGGGGATVPSQLGCTVTVVGSVMTLFSTASPSAPCVIGSRRYVVPETVTLGASAPSGTYSFEFRNSTGTLSLYARPPGGTTSTVTGSANITVESAGGFSTEGTPFFTWDGGPSAWTLGTGVDWRSFLTSQTEVTGTSGLTCAKAGGVVTCSINTAVISDLASAQTVSGKKTFTGSINIACGPLPGSPTLGDLACDSGDANKLKRYNGSSWVEVIGSVPLLSGNYWLLPAQEGPITHGTYTTLGTTPRVMHKIHTASAPVARFYFYIDPANPLGTGCGGNCGIVWGLYTAGCATQLATGTAYASTGTGLQSVVLGSTYNATIGTSYCWMVATDSAAVRISVPSGTSATIANAAYNAGTARNGTCSNPTTGSGATLALPTTGVGGCGTITGNGDQFNAWLAP